MTIVTGAQIRAGRALIGWSARDLAKACGLHRNSILYWEAAEGIPTGYAYPYACRKIDGVFEAAEIKLIASPAPGVRLCRKPNNYAIRAPVRPRHGVKDMASLVLKPVDDCLKQQGESGPPIFRGRRLCGAQTRRGLPCQRKALPNGRCRNHGGLSTGARTEAGRARVGAAQRARWERWRKSRAEAAV